MGDKNKGYLNSFNKYMGDKIMDILRVSTNICR